MPEIKTFKKQDGRTYRLVGRWSYERERGYSEPAQVLDNLLQVRRWFGWQTIEAERVPAHAWISKMCLGDTGGWQSALVKKHGAQTP